MIADKTNQILKSENIRAKKMFGQNFLKDNKVLEDIVKAANVTKEDSVIEIGPGLGALTERLCQNANKVLCYEIDNDLAKSLPERLKDYNNYQIINEDYLKRKVGDDIHKFLQADDVKVVANIPYNITSPIMLSILIESSVKTAVLMVQKELAERFASQPGTKEYGSISACLSYYGKNTIVRVVKRTCFNPVPNVDSAVYKFERNNKEIDADFMEFLKKCFSQKRKKLTNNIESVYNKTKLEIEVLLNELSLLSTIRAEEMSSEQLHELYLKMRS